MTDDDALLMIAGAIVLGLIPAVIAKRKGYPFFGWWVGGALLFIFALPAAILAKRRFPPSMTPCPACGNGVSKEAPACPRCGQPLNAGSHT